jgi:hypothetical protein
MAKKKSSSNDAPLSGDRDADSWRSRRSAFLSSLHPTTDQRIYGLVAGWWRAACWAAPFRCRQSSRLWLEVKDDGQASEVAWQPWPCCVPVVFDVVRPLVSKHVFLGEESSAKKYRHNRAVFASRAHGASVEGRKGLREGFCCKDSGHPS